MPNPETVTPQLRSSIAGLEWPAWPDAHSAQLLTLLRQAEETQWWPRARLVRHQLQQASLVVAHAARRSAFYRPRLPRGEQFATLAEFRALPIVTRAELQAAGGEWFSLEVPAEHGAIGTDSTSGSTGRRLRFRTTAATAAVNLALNLRGLLWHEMDFSAKAASIRRDAGDAGNWGGCFVSGPHVARDIRGSLDAHIDWLCAEQPAYLHSEPSLLVALALRCEERGAAMPFLRRLSAFGEPVDARHRRIARRVWQADIVDSYSARETGILTMQCPQSGLHHVAAENVLLEVLDARGRPCRPGAVGQVVVTSLNNFAAPLVRYAIGDYAEVGAACDCGRSLPVLARVLGRSRNMLLLPDGTRRWPFGDTGFAAHPAIRQFQVVQCALDQLELRLAVNRALSPAEIADVETKLLAAIGRRFRVESRILDEIPRGAGGKYEDFLCAIEHPPE